MTIVRKVSFTSQVSDEIEYVWLCSLCIVDSFLHDICGEDINGEGKT